MKLASSRQFSHPGLLVTGSVLGYFLSMAWQMIPCCSPDKDPARSRLAGDPLAENVTDTKAKVRKSRFEYDNILNTMTPGYFSKF